MNAVTIILGLAEIGLAVYRSASAEEKAAVDEQLRALLAKSDATPTATAEHRAVHEKHKARIEREIAEATTPAQRLDPKAR